MAARAGPPLPAQFGQTPARLFRCCQGYSLTSILEVRDDGQSEWIENLDYNGIQRYFQRRGGPPQAQEQNQDLFRIFFVSGERSQDSFHVHIDPQVLSLLCKHTQMCERFMKEIYQTEEWTRLAFGSNIRRGPAEELPILRVHHGFWTWDEPTSSHSFIHFRTNFRQTTYFCVNTPPTIVAHLVESIRNSEPRSIRKLFHVDAIVTEELLNSYRRAISQRNQTLIDIERTNVQDTSTSGIKKQTKDLHDLSVNWHTIYKDLVDLEEQIKHFVRLYETRVKALGPTMPDSVCDDNIQALSELEVKCQFYRRWAMTYRDRTTSRINLLHHLATQRDNRLNQHIANVTTVVALQTQRDSASMFTLAVVTIIFLPPTFVAGVFGTPFFEAGPGTLSLSNKIWVMPAVAIPLTLLVLSVWLLWFRRRLKRDRHEIEKTQGQQDVENGPSFAQYNEKVSLGTTSHTPETTHCEHPSL